MRKIFALLTSVVLILALVEAFNILTSNDKEIIRQRPILMVITLSIIIPLIVLAVWLWRPKRSANTMQLNQE